MSFLRCAILGAVIACQVASPAVSQTSSGLVARDAWLRPTGAGMSMTGGYLVLINTSSRPLRLRAASSPEATSVTLHRSVVSGGVARMESLTDGLVIPAGARITFQPGGYHLMVEGMKHPLKVGDRMKISLAVDAAAAVSVSFEVRPEPPAPPNSPPPSVSAMPNMKMR